jgi:hypothetical protein
MANHLRTAASWLRSSSLMASTLAAMPEFFQTYAQPFFTGDVPELLDLSAKVVATSPLPARTRLHSPGLCLFEQRALLLEQTWHANAMARLSSRSARVG